MKARDNPFSTDRVLRIRYIPQGWTWTDLMERLEALSYRGSIVGPHGSGKTTLLEDLEPRLAQKAFRVHCLRLDEEHRRFDPEWLRRFLAGLSREDLILLDGAEQLGPWNWRRIEKRSRAAGGLVVTTHRPGRLRTLVECRTSPKLLAGIVDLLLPGVAHPPRQLATLFRRHGGNLRGALRELYDRAALHEAGETGYFPSVEGQAGFGQTRSAGALPRSSTKFTRSAAIF
jgi:hypothetical protein